MVESNQQNSQAVLTAAGINGLTKNRYPSSAIFFVLLMFNLSFYNEVKLKGVRSLLYT